MGSVILNINQAIQLAALGPCLLIIVYILISSTRLSMSFLPVLFFVLLSTTFLFPILGLFPEFEHNKFLRASRILNENTLHAVSFLMVVQFLLGRCPPPMYWLILAIPFVGGGPLAYLAATQQSICLIDEACYPAKYIEGLYSLFGSSLMFMLLMAIIHRTEVNINKKDKTRMHKYWLIITIVGFNLLLTATDLAQIANKIKIEQSAFIKTIIGVGFVYVVMSSVFRVFSEMLGINPWRLRNKESIARDRWLSERIMWILREEAPYRNLGFNRKALADLLGVKDHTVSRIINERFGKTFSEMMNECRIHDAKKALREGTEPITVISFDSGFSSITSFNRVFKQATGLSPTEYRNSKEIPINVRNDNRKGEPA